jgi:hypothetical protein
MIFLSLDPTESTGSYRIRIHKTGWNCTAPLDSWKPLRSVPSWPVCPGLSVWTKDIDQLQLQHGRAGPASGRCGQASRLASAMPLLLRTRFVKRSQKERQPVVFIESHHFRIKTPVGWQESTLGLRSFGPNFHRTGFVGIVIVLWGWRRHVAFSSKTSQYPSIRRHTTHAKQREDPWANIRSFPSPLF